MCGWVRGYFTFYIFCIFSPASAGAESRPDGDEVSGGICHMATSVYTSAPLAGPLTLSHQTCERCLTWPPVFHATTAILSSATMCLDKPRSMLQVERQLVYEESLRGAAPGLRSCHFLTFFGDFKHLSWPYFFLCYWAEILIYWYQTLGEKAGFGHLWYWAHLNLWP